MSLLDAIHCPVSFLAFDPTQPSRGFNSEAGLTVWSQAFGHITSTCHASLSLLMKCEEDTTRSVTFLLAPTRWFCEPFKARVYRGKLKWKRQLVVFTLVVFLEQTGMVRVLSGTDRVERQCEEDQVLVLTAQGGNS